MRGASLPFPFIRYMHPPGRHARYGKKTSGSAARRRRANPRRARPPPWGDPGPCFLRCAGSSRQGDGGDPLGDDLAVGDALNAPPAHQQDEHGRQQAAFVDDDVGQGDLPLTKGLEDGVEQLQRADEHDGVGPHLQEIHGRFHGPLLRHEQSNDGAWEQVHQHQRKGHVGSMTTKAPRISALTRAYRPAA